MTERIWTELNRKQGQFENGDVGIARNGGYISNAHDLERYYRNGDLLAFYPTESIVFFKGGEEDA